MSDSKLTRRIRWTSAPSHVNPIRLLGWLCGVGLALCCQACGGPAQRVEIVGEKGEVLTSPFDGREWFLRNHRSDPGKSMSEYLPAGQSPDRWTESLGGVFRSYAVSNASPLEAYLKFQRDILRVCPAARFQIHDQSESDLVYGWRIDGCAAQPDQTELGRFVRGRAGIYSIAYVSKGPPLTTEQTDKWLALLRSASPTPPGG
jgi:hypothetical protein